jgi:hypothetical protein
VPDECAPLDATCKIGDAISSLAGSFFEKLTTDVAESAVEALTASMTWWIGTPSVDPNSEAVKTLNKYTIPIIAIVLVGSILNQAIRMMITRRADPGLNVALGLIRYAVVNAVALTLLATALTAGDEFSTYLIADSSRQFTEQMALVLTTMSKQQIFLVFLLSLIALILSLIQWVLLFFRQAGILVLAVLIPLAASGSINESTKPWFNRMLPWLISLVLYKPIAALIYAIGFTFMGEGQDFATIMTGLVVLVLAVVAMPAMMRFFAWSQTAITTGTSSGAALAGVASGAASLSALQASRTMDSTGPGTGPRSNGSSSGSNGAAPTGSGPAGGGGGTGVGSWAGGNGNGSGALTGGGQNGAPGATGSAGPAGTAGGTGAGGAPGAGGATAAGAGAGGGAGGGAAATGAAGGAAAAAGPATAAAAAAAAAARMASGSATAASNAFTPPEGDQR